jgi:hypothetical protein
VRLSPSIAGSVLAAFVATTAAPGPSLVVHRHGGAGSHHVHAAPRFAHGEHHEVHHRGYERDHPHENATSPGLDCDDHDPLAHAHLTSAFQPAAAAALPALAAGTIVLAATPVTPEAPLASRPQTSRSRGPPSSPRVG